MVALVKPIHDLCYHLEKFIVIISNTADQAAGKLKDIRKELLENVHLVQCFGPFFATKKVAETNYVASCGNHQCSFVGYGAATEIRGIRFGEARPSKIILDDVEHSEEVTNEELRNKFDDWFKQVVSKLGDENTKIEVIGTLLHSKSLLANLLVNPAYEGNKYKAVKTWSTRQDLWDKWEQIYIDLDNPNRKAEAEEFYKANESEMLKDTEILWPAKETYRMLMEERLEIGHRAFAKERQNDPRGAEDSLFDDLGWYTETEEGFLIADTGRLIPKKELLQVFGVIDPATGQTKAKKGKAGDFTCVLTGYTDTKGRLFVHQDYTKRAKPTEYINHIFDLDEVFNYDVFGVETNLYRNLLLENIYATKKEREARYRAEKRKNWGVKMLFQDIEQTDNKEKRIYTLEPKIKNRYILFNKRLSQEFRSQVEAFPKGEHDDAPDALEMLWSLASGRYRMGGIAIEAMRR